MGLKGYKVEEDIVCEEKLTYVQVYIYQLQISLTQGHSGVGHEIAN